MNGIFLTTDDLVVKYGNKEVKDGDIERIRATRYSMVFVEFNSKYATIKPSNDCATVDINSLSKALEQYVLLKYKYVCIRCRNRFSFCQS